MGGKLSVSAYYGVLTKSHVDFREIQLDSMKKQGLKKFLFNIKGSVDKVVIDISNGYTPSSSVLADGEIRRDIVKKMKEQEGRKVSFVINKDAEDNQEEFLSLLLDIMDLHDTFQFSIEMDRQKFERLSDGKTRHYVLVLKHTGLIYQHLKYEYELAGEITRKE